LKKQAKDSKGTRKKSFQIILRPNVIIALFLFPRGATKCKLITTRSWRRNSGELLTAPGRSKNGATHAERLLMVTTKWFKN